MTILTRTLLGEEWNVSLLSVVVSTLATLTLIKLFVEFVETFNNFFFFLIFFQTTISNNENILFFKR
jgi:hypothetical protein